MLIDRPTEIQEIQLKAIEIDNRLYKRRLEKRGRHNNGYHRKENSKKTQKETKITTATGTHPRPIEIDQVNKNHQKDRKRKLLTDQQKEQLAKKAYLKYS